MLITTNNYFNSSLVILKKNEGYCEALAMEVNLVSLQCYFVKAMYYLSCKAD